MTPAQASSRPSRSSLRLATLFTLSLLLGLLSTIVVAQACLQATLRPRFDGRAFALRAPETAEVWVVQFGVACLGHSRLDYLFTLPQDKGNQEIPLSPWFIPDPPNPPAGHYADTSGLPARCLWRGGTRGERGLTPGSVFAQRILGPLTLATGILWPGLLLNTAFYAVFWFALFLLPGRLRRAHRRRRGRCPTCGYDLTASPTGQPCPECGSELLATKPASDHASGR